MFFSFILNSFGGLGTQAASAPRSELLPFV